MSYRCMSIDVLYYTTFGNFVFYHARWSRVSILTCITRTILRLQVLKSFLVCPRKMCIYYKIRSFKMRVNNNGLLNNNIQIVYIYNVIM